MKKLIMIICMVLTSLVLFAGSQDDFFKAVHEGDVSKVKLMLSKGFNVNTRYIDEDNEPSKVCPMCEGETALIVSASRGNLKMVQLLLQYKADPNIVNEEDQYNALRYASQYGYLAVVKALVEGGANVNLGNPLVHAEMNGKVDVVKYLKSKGAK